MIEEDAAEDNGCQQLTVGQPGFGTFRPRRILHLEAVPDYRRHNICRVHVVILTKIAVVCTMPYYLAVLAFICHHGNATTFMFAAIILGSVASFSLYGAFKGSKMCLVPFIFMQVVLIVYSIILAVICLVGFFHKDIQLPGEGIFPTDESQLSLLVLSGMLLLSVPFLSISTHIVYRDFLFISELDEALDRIEMNRRPSLLSKNTF